MKNFDSTVKSNLKDEQISKLESEIAVIENEHDNIKEAIKTHEGRFKVLKDTYSKEFGQKIQDKRLTGVEIEELSENTSSNDLKKAIAKLVKNYSLSRQKNDISEDVKSIENVEINDVNIDVEAAVKLLAKNVGKKSAGDLKKRIDEFKKIESVEKIKFSFENWLEDGAKLLEYSRAKSKSQCPLCASDIDRTIDQIINEFKTYFNRDYENLQVKLKKGSERVKELKSYVETNEKNKATLLSVSNKYEQEWNHEAYKPKNLVDLLESLDTSIESKRLHINDDFSTKLNSNDLIAELDSYLIYVDNLKAQRESLLDHLNSQNLNPNSILKDVKTSYKRLILTEFDCSGEGNCIEDYSNKSIQLVEIKNKLITKNQELTKAKARLKSEAKYVNRNLEELGIHHFTIDINTSKPTENIEILFKSGTTKSNLKHSISEGEKTALAFAYFLSKTQFEIIDNTELNIENVIIVLDDPVSSLDENRLYSSACVIHNKFSEVKQLFIFSHNLVFLKFIGNLIGHKERCDYFISTHKGGACLEDLPDGLANYTTTYFQKLQDIIDLIDSKIHYEDGKKFIPNNIRVVLESFLSFKFCVLKQGSSAESVRVAGLDKLINRITGDIGLLANYEHVDDVSHQTIISKLRNIQKITDPQAHGSPQSINEFNFISKNELEVISCDTINIIKFLDRIHLSNLPSNRRN